MTPLFSWFSRLVDLTLGQVPPQSYWERARTRLFVSVLWVGLGLVLVVLAYSLATAASATLLVGFGLAAWQAITLDLVRRNHVSRALVVYGWGLPLLFVARYFSVLLAPETTLTPLLSDYFLTFVLVNLVLQTLFGASTWSLWFGFLASLVAEFLSVLYLLYPKLSAADDAELLGALARFVLISGALTGLLAYLQTVFQRTTHLHTRSQKEMEVLIEQRTADLVESQQRLERASVSLAEGEKLASLGRIVAGIAHEMNTPLGALQASANHLTAHTNRILADWTHLIPRLGSDQAALLLEVIDQAQTDIDLLDSRRVRELRKDFARRLKDFGFPDAEAKARVLADLGLHELRDSWLPLLLAPGAEALLQSATVLVEWERAVSIVRLSGTKLADQVDGLRRYAKNPKANTAVVAVDLSHNLETVLLVYRSQIPRGIKISKEFPDRGPWVKANPDRLMQVWSNLVMNAIQAMGPSGKLSIEVDSGKTWALVKVKDSGPGIPPDIQEKVLEPFFSTKANGEGMGLGLKIVSTIVDEHGGKLTFESVPSKTVFRVRLPLWEGAVPSE
ncbi:MAG: HAMP domain-containing sensor histidine kinase [Spirochaetales bacterium]